MSASPYPKMAETFRLRIQEYIAQILVPELTVIIGMY